MEWLARLSWVLLGLVHLMPALAFFKPPMIARLYGIDASSPVFLLMQHRAALFVVILIVCIWAAWVPEVRRLAVVGVAFSMLSFLWLYWQAGSPPALKTIAFADLIALPALAFAAWSAFSQP